MEGNDLSISLPSNMNAPSRGMTISWQTLTTMNSTISVSGRSATAKMATHSSQTTTVVMAESRKMKVVRLIKRTRKSETLLWKTLMIKSCNLNWRNLTAVGGTTLSIN